VFDDGGCTPEQRDALRERVWKELEAANGCHTIKTNGSEEIS